MTTSEYLNEVEERAELPKRIASGWPVFDKETGDRFDRAVAQSQADVPHLLAALRAVLEVADAADLAADDEPDQDCGLFHTHHLRAVIDSALGVHAEGSHDTKDPRP